MGTLSPDLEDKYFIYRLVFEGNQLLTEVEKWDLPTIMEANEVMDFQSDMKIAYGKASEPKSKGK